MGDIADLHADQYYDWLLDSEVFDYQPTNPTEDAQLDFSGAPLPPVWPPTEPAK